MAERDTSPAYAVLSPSAHKVLGAIEDKIARGNGAISYGSIGRLALNAARQFFQVYF